VTRINLGVSPEELCDQMLIAEYRELPRMCAFAEKRHDTYRGYGPRPLRFTLNTGHMCYFLPYGKTLQKRFNDLCAEMRYRGFTAQYEWKGYPWMQAVPSSEHAVAREALVARIQARLLSMRRRPTWTKRQAPTWALCAA